MLQTGSNNESLAGGLASHRNQAAAAFAVFEDKGNTSGVVLLPDEQLSGVSPRTAALFRKLTTEAPRGHFLTIDVPMLVEYCVVLERLEAGRAEFLKAPATLKTSGHMTRANPFLAQYGQLQQRAVRLAKALRLMPFTRRRAVQHGQQSKPKKTEQESQPNAEEVSSTRGAHLMFGGRRAAEALGVDDDD
jgi:phage terminase small subunit